MIASCRSLAVSVPLFFLAGSGAWSAEPNYDASLVGDPVYGGEKLGHWSVVFVAMRAE